MPEKVQVPALSAVTEDITTEWTLSLLEDPDRRRLLAVLDELETPERLSALTRTVAMDAERVDDRDVRRISLRLYHTHVPKLEDAGVIRFDEQSGTVALTERGEALASSLELPLEN